MPYSAGGRWVPAPGQSYIPRRLSQMVADMEIPVRAKGSELNFLGLRVELPERASVKIDTRARRAWVRSAGVVRSYTPEGEERVSPAAQRILLESWDAL
jgi:hypothetical protein